MSNSASNWSEKLVAYLDGELVGEERRDMEARIASDEDLQQELDRIKLARQGVKQFGVRQTVGKLHQEMMRELETPIRRIHPKRNLRAAMLIAASLLVAIAGITLYRNYSITHTELFNSHFKSYELSTTRDGSATGSRTEALYREKNFREASETTDTIVMRDLFLKGMSALELRNAAAAIDNFNRVLRINHSSGDKQFKDETEYYLSLAFLLNGDYDLSSVLLEQIRENPSHLYHERVSRKLIRQVNRLK